MGQKNIDTDAVQQLIKSQSTSNFKSNEIDDDMFILPEKTSHEAQNEIHSANDEDDSSDHEIISLTNNEDRIPETISIDFNSYFSNNEFKNADSFFEV